MYKSFKKQGKKIISTATVAMMALVLSFAMVGCGNTGAGNDEGGSASNSPTPAVNTSPITVVWYPNESANDYVETRTEIGRLIEQATGRSVEHKLTTDYVITIEAIASGAADIAINMGAVGYIEAKSKNPEIDVLFVNSGASGTLDDAIYYSWLAVRAAEADQFKAGSDFSIDNIKGRIISFVSNSSTSGFKVPTGDIINHFAADNLSSDDLVEGGSDAFFDEVLFGGSHQGSAFNLMSGNADVAAFCDTELQPYVKLKDGTENRVGATYTIRDGASAPFDTVVGEDFVIINSTPVLNGPNVYNPANLSPEEVQSIRDLFTSDEVTNNSLIFFDPDIEGAIGLFKITSSKGYVLANDSWYDPIREMM
ncbi:MAG: PhnD/SsuA/transferrin family substrate-binding protein [Coriobacteriia bacterium]|nr:PhnD/SsuA/transferrin family substrate-binding protein [Coriobacteriia bacterium]